MRTLTKNELNLVSGGVDFSDAAANIMAGAGVGTIAGGAWAASGILAGTTETLAVSTGAAAGAGLVAAGVAGWEAGQWLNENTPIQDWISTGIENTVGYD